MVISNTLIDCVFAREIIDSRGNPTVETKINLNNGIKGRAAILSGASTGEREAIESRDNTAPKAQLGDESLRKRFLGKGVLAPVNNVNAIGAGNIVGMDVIDQMALDSALIALDGTESKSKLRPTRSLVFQWLLKMLLQKVWKCHF